jgi:hypothetical protein
MALAARLFQVDGARVRHRDRRAEVHRIGRKGMHWARALTRSQLSLALKSGRVL